MPWVLAAAAWGFAEATLFFVVPDVLLTWIAAFRTRHAWRAVGACLGGALLGGALMFVAAAREPTAMRELVERVPAVSQGLLARTGAALDADYGLQMLRGGLSGVPYKVMAVEAAARDGSLPRFLAWSVPARLPRWIALVVLARGVAALVRRRAVRPDRWLVGLLLAGWSAVYVVYFSVMAG